ncbi:MAG: sortase [Chloroflexia bacterium]
MDLAEAHELQMDSKGRIRKSFSPIRFAGNLLIISGLFLLIGIGAWQGYNWWSNQQFLDNSSANGWRIETTINPGEVAGAVMPTATALPQPPPPNLNSSPGITQWLTISSRQVDNSPPVHLLIPSVGIDSEVVPVSWQMLPGKNGADARTEWQVADYAVGHHAGSANPGQVGNVVLSGHVDYRGEVFKELHKVQKGDTVMLDTEKGQYVYIVTDLVIVKEEGVPEEQKRQNAAYMNPTPDQTLTMITCWPYGIDDHRLIVIAKPYQSSQSANSEFFVR